MEGADFLTMFLFSAVVFAALARVFGQALRRIGGASKASRLPQSAGRKRMSHLLQDEIGQKFAAARVNLSALRVQLRSGGVPEVAELDTALELLDDGCRDLRTVSRLMAAEEATGSEGHEGKRS